MAGKEDTKRKILSVKVSEIPHAVDEQQLSTLFKEDGGIKLSSVHLIKSDPFNHAFVNCETPQDAKKAVEKFNGYNVCGNILKVKLKASVDQSVKKVETNRFSAGSDAKQFSVKISNISSNTTQKTLEELFKTTVHLRSVSNKPSYAHANYTTSEDMSVALQLHNSIIDGYKIQVKEKDKSRSLSQSQNMVNYRNPMSATLHKFFCKRMESSIKAFEAKGGRIHWEKDVLTCAAPDADTVAHFKDESIACLDEEIISLSSEKWNLIMSLHPDGSYLFKQLIRPFRSNPNVVIEPVMSTAEVYCVGLRGAVRDAKLALVSELYKEITFDGAKLLFVLKFLPQVKDEILNKHRVSMEGFYPGSTRITLLGSSEGIYEAYNILSGIFDRHMVINTVCIGRLVPSAQKRIALENLHAVLCTQNESGAICYAEDHSRSVHQISILICGAGEVPNKVASILRQPEQRELVLINIDVMQKLKALPECSFDQLFHSFGVFIQENVLKPGLLIQGYIQAEVNEAFSILSKATGRFTTCSPDFPLAPDVACFKYNCHPKYKSQIQEYVTEPLQKRLNVSFTFNDLSKPPPSPVKDPSSTDNKASFEIVVQSNNAEHLSLARKELEKVHPQSKFCSWSKNEYEVISKEVKKKKKTIEQSNHVCISFVDKKHAVVIYGLNPAEVSSTEIHLRDCVKSKLVVESSIQVNLYESLFLRKKCNTSLKEICSVRFPAASDFQNNSAHLVLKGPKAKVELAMQRINEAINNLKVQEIKFKHDCYGEMWKRKWIEVKAQQEDTHNVLVNLHVIVDKKDASYKTPADIGGTVEIAVIGKDENAVSKVRDFIEDIGATLLRKTITTTKGQLKAVLEGLQSKKLRLREDHNTEVVLDWEKYTIEFITPNVSEENLEAAHSSVMAYIQGVVIHKETVVINNCGLVVLLQQKNCWQQIISIAKQHAVTVKLISNGIDTRGKLDDVANAKKSIKIKLQEYLKLIEKRKIMTDILLSPILSTPSFENIVSKFRQHYGVVVSYAKCSTVYSTEVKTPNDACFAIDICVGNILTEMSDATVNVTNCNLQHTEGLAKEMVNAGGSSIQKESDDYVKAHGIVGQCEAVCLDSGDLKCGKIIHCVPPVWVDGQHGEAKDVNKTVTNCLLRAEECLTGTILMPSFPCGVSSISEYAEASLKAVLDLCNSGSLKFLNSVKFIIPTLGVAKEFEKQLKVLQPNRSGYMQKRLEVKVVWKYENDQGQMDSYKEEQSQAIEAMWQSKTPSEIQIGQWKYTFNFDSNPMQQINKTTNRSRTIVRTTCETDGTTAVTEVDDQVEVILVGLKEGLVEAENEINKFFESSVISEPISLSTPLPRDVVDSICKKYKVKRVDFSSSKVVLKGLETNITKAKLEIQDILLQDYSKADLTKSYPDEWEPQNEEPLELKPLTRNSPEWSKVSQKFLTTMPSGNIIKIERIQNKWLWEKYSQHSDRMKRKNGGYIDEKLLFHGTRNTQPSRIYQDEEGFDMRFSNAGLWGNGNYFAVNASYSHGYAHVLSDGTRQMFLAKVLTGHSTKCTSNSSLRMPPVRQHSAKGGDMRYDTVTGETGGSQVFITYSNDKAYPFYLISYK